VYPRSQGISKKIRDGIRSLKSARNSYEIPRRSERLLILKHLEELKQDESILCKLLRIPYELRLKTFKKKDRPERKQAALAKEYPKTAGIDEAEIQRRKAEGECVRCAWPSDRKGEHKVKDCIRPIKLDKGTANYPKGKEYQRKQSHQQPTVEEDSTEGSSSEEASDEL
jgi:hypothetical protein